MATPMRAAMATPMKAAMATPMKAAMATPMRAVVATPMKAAMKAAMATSRGRAMATRRDGPTHPAKKMTPAAMKSSASIAAVTITQPMITVAIVATALSVIQNQNKRPPVVHNPQVLRHQKRGGV